MNIRELLNRLHGLGYSLHLEGDKIRFKYNREGEPPEEARTLLEEIKARKEEVITFLRDDPGHLVITTLAEINQHWQPGRLERLKQAGRFDQVVRLEEEINRLALAGDLPGLKEALRRYRDLLAREPGEQNQTVLPFARALEGESWR